MALNWQTPKKPTYATGRIVIHSDDGRLYDWTYHVPIIRRAIARGNQFNPKNNCIFCPAVNTQDIVRGVHRAVGLPTMTYDNIKAIQDNGGEIVSHGREHLYLGDMPLSQAASAGATRLYYSTPAMGFYEGKKFYIEEGANREDFIVLSIKDNNDVNNYINIDRALVNAYTTSAKMYLHEDEMTEQVGGIVSELLAQGITCKNHVNAWYVSSPIATSYQEQYFDSVVRGGEDVIEDPATCDLYYLKRTNDIRSRTTSEIDAILDDLQAKDGVAFIQMHGNYNLQNFYNLDYLITKAYERGIRIITHSEAVDYIKSTQAV